MESDGCIEILDLASLMNPHKDKYLVTLFKSIHYMHPVQQNTFANQQYEYQDDSNNNQTIEERNGIGRLNWDARSGQLDEPS